MKVDLIVPGAILLTAETDHENTYSFMRLQEFYENEDRSRQGKYFSLDEVIDHYGDKRGIFSYPQDWAGFNIPGHIVDKFIKLHKHDFTEKEKSMFELVKKVIDQYDHAKVDGKYYLIGVKSELYIDHELCHAMWYLYPKFRKEAKKLLKKLPKKQKKAIKRWLKDSGYADNVLDDEINAYLATSDMYMIRQSILASLSQKQKQSIDWTLVYAIVANYWKFKHKLSFQETEIKVA